MKRNFIFTIGVILFLLPAAQGFAQESIMNDISYPFLQKLIAAAKEYYPQIKIKQEQVNAAKINYNGSKSAWFDGLSLSYVYSPKNTLSLTSTSTTTSGSGTSNPSLFSGYQVSVSVNVGSFIKNPFNTKVAKANYNIALLEQQAFNGNIETEVTKLYLTYIQQIASLRLRTKTAQDIGSLLEQSRRDFEKGDETIENYTKATTSFSDINQLKIDAEVAVLNAKVALEEIIGKKLEEVK
ncbi:TolC family protein [Mucilaginibacter paludis]|uniref:Outer membrane efflux protein n=1 Tax=Mucilaginibacter paludis DSM 18603 TaxID=714943 RepID=H1Y202_9SPHI|nr:TolC family protein [Mucilaginibacter paludis]EHQ25705.1 outer membrane efflux protein [Mucilaginibacter paludis DSM 18603]